MSAVSALNLLVYVIIIIVVIVILVWILQKFLFVLPFFYEPHISAIFAQMAPFR